MRRILLQQLLEMTVVRNHAPVSISERALHPHQNKNSGGGGGGGGRGGYKNRSGGGRPVADAAEKIVRPRPSAARSGGATRRGRESGGGAGESRGAKSSCCKI